MKKSRFTDSQIIAGFAPIQSKREWAGLVVTFLAMIAVTGRATPCRSPITPAVAMSPGHPARRLRTSTRRGSMPSFR